VASFQRVHALRVRAALAGDRSRVLQPADGPTAAGEDIKPGPEPEVLLLFSLLCMVVLLHGDNDGDNKEDYQDVENWWGIWQPDEIRRLVDWLAIKNGVTEGKHLTAKSDGRNKHTVSVLDGRRRSAASTSTIGSLKAGYCKLRSGARSSNLTLLSHISDTKDEPEPRFDSAPSFVSGDELDSEPNEDDSKAQMQVDDDVRLLPSQNKLKTLVKASMEYAEVLD
jgi:hypothetical protein